MKKQLLILILAVLLPMVANADAVEIDGIYYNLISKGGSNVAEVTRNPNYYTGNVTIPETVTYKGTDYSVTTICDYAFNYCSNLTSITIPKTITIIGAYAFDRCSNLTIVNISDIKAWCNISFGSNPLIYAHRLYLNGTEIKDLVIPNNVNIIEDYAFQGCSGLTSVSIHDGVVSIGDGAFSQCSGLTSAIMPNSISSIGSGAFRGCSNLTTVTIPNAINSIGEYVFGSCSSLTSIVIPDNISSIGQSAFAYCSGLTSISFDRK